MMRLKVGSVYTAHRIEGGERVGSDLFYHFDIIAEKEDWKGRKHYIGLKVGITYNHNYSQCFWFDEDGLHCDGELSFKLKRKIKKEREVHAFFE